MADYSVDIKIAVAGSRELKAARKETTALSKEITTLNRLANKQSKTLPNSFNNLNKVLGQAKGNLNKVALGTTRYLRAINDVIDKEERLNRAYRKQKTDFKVIQRLRMKGLDINKQNIQAVRDELAAEIKLALAKKRTAKAEKEGAISNKRRNRIIQSAGIGGGFPLLFGGGPLQAAAGALGGGIGERMSPGGGFAGSIVATAAISKIQEFVNASREVGNALKDANLGLEKLEQLGYKVDSVTKKQVETLLELGKVREAENLVNQKFAEIIGPQAVKNLQNLDTEFDKLDQQISKLFLRLSADLAPIFTTIIDFTTKLAVLLNALPLKDLLIAINPIVKLLNAGDALKEIKATLDANTVLDFAGAITGFKPLNQPNLNKNVDLSTNLTEGGNGKNGKSSKTSVNLSPFELKVLNERIALQKLSGNLLDKDVVTAKKRIIEAQTHLKIMKAEGDMDKIAIIQAERLLEVNRLNKEIDVAKGKAFAENVLKPQMDALARQEQEDFDSGAALGKRLASEVEIFNNLDKEIEKMGLVTQLEKAKTVEQKANIQLKLYELDLGQEIQETNRQDILSLIRKKEGLIENNRLLKEQKQIAKDLKYTFAVEMSTAIKGLITGANSLNDAFRNVLNTMADAFLNIGLFGNVAGNLKGGKGLLGTLFGGLLATGGPAKAGKSYIVGEQGPELFTPGVSGMVSPNNALGGSTNVVVNVDASGSSVEGDEDRGRELGRLISVAVQSELVQQKRPGGLLA